jgi:hypothetical protein
MLDPFSVFKLVVVSDHEISLKHLELITNDSVPETSDHGLSFCMRGRRDEQHGPLTDPPTA